MAGSKLARLTFILSANSAKFRREMNKAEGVIGKFKVAMKSLGGVIAAVGLGALAGEAFQLAAAGEGVRVAFSRLNDPNLLKNLRTATQGTVSDLNLMTAAVKANNFKIPLDQLGTLLQFAQQRALETGESVDYLVESIIKGIARKSLPILDNLGLSAVEVRAEFDKTGDMAQAVGNIIARDMGEPIVTMQTEIDRLRAMVANLKEWLGVRLVKAIDATRHLFNVLKIAVLGVTGGMKQLGEWAKAAGYAMAHPLQWKEIKKRFADARTNVAAIDNQYQELIRSAKAADAAMMNRGKGSTGGGGAASGFIPTGESTTKKKTVDIAALEQQRLITNQIEKRAEALENLRKKEEALSEAVMKRARTEDFAAAAGQALQQTDNQRTQEALKYEFALMGVNAATQMFNDLAQISSMAKEDQAEAFKRASISIVNNLIREGVAAIVANTLKSSAAIGALALPLAAAAGAGASALFSAVVPKMATGGIIPGGFPNDTYPALLSSGETVIPKPKPLSGGGGGYLYGRLSGEDILISNNRTGYRNKRITGR